MIYRRNEGLFSNLNVFQRIVCHKFLDDKIQYNYVEMILDEYDKSIDFYPHLFRIDKSISLSEGFCSFLLDNCNTRAYGLFQNLIDINSIDLVRKKYLNYSLEVLEKANEIISQLPKEYTFLWYRGTDKKSEAHIIDIKKVVDIAIEKDLPLVVKTDEIKFVDYLKENKIDATILEAMPIKSNGECLHKHLYKISGYDFFKQNGLTKVEYLQKLLALTIVAEKSNFFVCTPSNIVSWVIQNRGHFNNIKIFRNNEQFLYEGSPLGPLEW